MRKIFCFFYFFFLTSEVLHSSEYVSSRTYPSESLQKIFNITKSLFHQTTSEYLIKTHWDTLEIAKRTTQGFFFIDVVTQHIKLSATPNEDAKTITLNLEIYTKNQKGETTHLLAKDFLHTLLWNRIDAVYDTSTPWIDCTTLSSDFLLEKFWYHRNDLCLRTPSKNSSYP